MAQSWSLPAAEPMQDRNGRARSSSCASGSTKTENGRLLQARSQNNLQGTQDRLWELLSGFARAASAAPNPGACRRAVLLAQASQSRETRWPAARSTL